MRLLSAARYEQLVQAEAQAIAYQWQIKRLTDERGSLLSQIEVERRRAENAVDALLLTKGGSPITPSPALPESVDLDPFDDDPKELEALMRRMQASPVTTLEEGRGDAK
jgi:hypothetical protein